MNICKKCFQCKDEGKLLCQTKLSGNSFVTHVQVLTFSVKKLFSNVTTVLYLQNSLNLI